MVELIEVCIKYDERGPYCEIPLTRGMFAIVSPEDYLGLSQYSWQAKWSKKTRSFYAKRTFWPDKISSRDVYMHRQILGLGREDRNKWGDHINLDTLDNRRLNLRVATPSQSACNSHKGCRNKTGYRGVLMSVNGKFYSKIRIGLGKRVSTPQVDTAAEAHADYCRLANKYHGEFATYA